MGQPRCCFMGAEPVCCWVSREKMEIGISGALVHTGLFIRSCLYYEYLLFVVLIWLPSHPGMSLMGCMGFLNFYLLRKDTFSQEQGQKNLPCITVLKRLMESHLGCNMDLGLSHGQDLPPSSSVHSPSNWHIGSTVLPVLAGTNGARGQSAVPAAEHLLTCASLFGSKMPSRCLYSMPRLVSAGFFTEVGPNQRRGADDPWLPVVQTQHQTCPSCQRCVGQFCSTGRIFSLRRALLSLLPLFPC